MNYSPLLVKVILLTFLFRMFGQCEGKWEIINPTIPTSGFKDVLWTGEKLITVGKQGVIASSSDGIIWKAVNSGTTRTLNAICSNDDLFVAVGDSGIILTSEDEEIWTRRNVYHTTMFNDVIWTGTQFVIVGDQRCVLTSVDGINWVTQTSIPATAGDLSSVVWNGSQIKILTRFAALLTSSDGITWDMFSMENNIQGMNSIIWANNTLTAVGGKYVSSSSNPPFEIQLATSINDTTWVTRSTSQTGLLFDVCWTGSRYVAVGWDNVEDSTMSIVMTSQDGVTWTKQHQAAETCLFSIAWTGGFLVAVGENGIILRSADEGESWTYQKPLFKPGIFSDLTDVAWGANTFIVTGMKGVIVSSADGKNWKKEVSGTSRCLRSVIWGNDRFVAVGDSGLIVTSSDGATWNTIQIATSCDLIDIAWGGGEGEKKFVAVGENQNTTSNVNPIFYSVDGVVWDSSLVEGDYSLRVVAANDKMFVASGSEIYLVSADGVTWQSQVSPFTVSGVCFNEDTCYSTSFGAIRQSADGLTWSYVTEVKPYYFNDINYGSSGFIAVGKTEGEITEYDNFEITHYNAGITTSGDGLSWKSESIEIIPELTAVSCGDGKCVAAGKLGTIVLLSSEDAGVESDNANRYNSRKYSFFTSGKMCTYTLPAQSFVHIALYDISGKIVRTLVRGRKSAGRHLAVYPDYLPKGHYIIEIKAGKNRRTEKVIFVH